MSLGELEDAISEVVSPEEFDKIEFGLAFNTSGTLIPDLLEASGQVLLNDFTRFWRGIANLEPLPDSFKQSLLDFVAQLDENALLSNQNLFTHVASYKASILEGKKVIVVAHSQGNLFANQAYANLTPQERLSFGIESVANPDSAVAGGNIYTTLHEDLVILAVRALKMRVGLPAPLPSNLSNLRFPADGFGHSFDSVYLSAGSNSRTKIQDDFIFLKALLAQPNQTGSQGIITVTLTWGAQPDVDLHVFEPSGTHVYYANLSGSAGYLDVDDVTSFGPEHYIVSCDSLQSGVYHVGVNYYYGGAPEVATVLIQAGLESRGFSIPLSSAVGSSGNLSPIHAADIVVEGNVNDGFTFRIQ